MHALTNICFSIALTMALYTTWAWAWLSAMLTLIAQHLSDARDSAQVAAVNTAAAVSRGFSALRARFA